MTAEQELTLDQYLDRLYQVSLTMAVGDRPQSLIKEFANVQVEGWDSLLTLFPSGIDHVTATSFDLEKGALIGMGDDVYLGLALGTGFRDPYFSKRRRFQFGVCTSMETPNDIEDLRSIVAVHRDSHMRDFSGEFYVEANILMVFCWADSFIHGGQDFFRDEWLNYRLLNDEGVQSGLSLVHRMVRKVRDVTPFAPQI